MKMLEPVRVQNVVANLRAEGDVLFAGFEFGGFGLAFFQFQLIQFRAQNLHRYRSILNLRALILAGDDDSGRQMRDTNRRIRHVDVLTASARRAIGVNSQILVLNVNLDVLVNFGRDKKGWPSSSRRLSHVSRRTEALSSR